MKKILIPAILAVTVLVAASFALMPVQRVSTTHASAAGGVASDLTCAGCVDTTDIALDTIAAVDIAPDAVAASELAANAVTAAGGELADGVLTADAAGRLKMADGFVDSAEIALDTIAAVDIATGGVATAEILDNSVAHVDLGDGAIWSTSFTTVLDATPPINGDIALPDTITGAGDRIVVIATIDILESGLAANDVVLTVSMLGADAGIIAGPTAYTFDLALGQRDSFAAVFFITSANDGVDALLNIDVRVAATGFDAADTLNSFIVVGFALPQTE